VTGVAGAQAARSTVVMRQLSRIFPARLRVRDFFLLCCAEEHKA
jgi:hypothetical protein